jgi:hypothetical protein
MKNRALLGLVAALAVTMLALPAGADSLPQEDFEDFNAVTPFQPINDWAYTGTTNYDVGVVETGIDGTQSFRISNGTMSGSFGDWVFSPEIAPATEAPGSQEFITTFEIQSATGANQGMSMNVAPQTAGGARMTNLRFEDRGDGIHVLFSDVLNPTETVGQDNPGTPLVNEFPEELWRTVDIKTLDYASKHTVTIKMNLLDGPHNDVVQVYIDGSAGLVEGRPSADTLFAGFFAPVDNQPTVNKAKAGQTIPLKWTLNAKSFATSWEDYYRYNTESNAGLGAGPFDTRSVDSLIIQARCAAVGPCANALAQGNGYWIDDVTYSSGAIVNPLPIATTGVGDPSVYGPQPFSQHVEDCVSGVDVDAIETYTSNTGGLMYHGNGVWQYNWQTPKAYAGKCVELTLNLGDYTTSFQFTK